MGLTEKVLGLRLCVWCGDNIFQEGHSDFPQTYNLINQRHNRNDKIPPAKENYTDIKLFLKKIAGGEGDEGSLRAVGNE